VDLKYDDRVLAAYFFRDPDPRTLDLIRVAGAVALMDRRVTRRPSVDWGRDLELSIPVSNPDFWSSSDVSKSLLCMLGMLTGDTWNIKFHKQWSKREEKTRSYLPFPPDRAVAMAFSDGLDSLAVWRLAAAGAIHIPSGPNSRLDLVLVTTGHQRDAERERKHGRHGETTRRVAVPFQLPTKGGAYRLRESSYRSRAFVFQTMAAIAAVQSEGDLVIVAESGQGSLGPWLVPVGQEASDIRTHPLFTRALSRLLEFVFGRRIKFVHPQLWLTKGETLRLLVEAKLHDGWQDSFSCAVQIRHQTKQGARLHCGICPNCLLRRQSVFAAGLPDPDQQYDHAELIEGFGLLTPNTSDQKVDRIIRRAALGFMPLHQLARLADEPFSECTLPAAYRILAEIERTSEEVIAERVRRLIGVHDSEFSQFINSRGPNSFLRHLASHLS